jgi:hypothetical protein
MSGRFSPVEEQITTTTTFTVTATQTSTSSVTTTETRTGITTSTTTVVREPPITIPPPANSSAVIHGHLLLNGSIFLMLSIDKPTYVLGDIVHIKGTLTNLTPNNISLSISWDASTTIVYEKEEKPVWVNPEGFFHLFLAPPPMEDVDLKPGETLSLRWVTVDWNMTGLHRSIQSGKSRVVYDDALVPEGQYYLLWSPMFTLNNVENHPYERIEDTISFTITR